MYLFLDHNLAMFLNMFFPDSQNWIVFQPNIIIDAKLGKCQFLHDFGKLRNVTVCGGKGGSLLLLVLQVHFSTHD